MAWNLKYNFGEESEEMAENLFRKLKLETGFGEKSRFQCNPVKWMMCPDETFDNNCRSERVAVIVESVEGAPNKPEACHNLQEDLPTTEPEIAMQEVSRNTSTAEHGPKTTTGVADDLEQPHKRQKIKEDAIFKLLHSDSADVNDTLRFLVKLPENQLEDACADLQLSQLSDGTTAAMAQAMIHMGSDLSHTSGIIITKHLLGKKVINLRHNAPRLLITSLVNFTKAYPCNSMEGIMFYALASCPLGPPQCDILGRLAKEAFAEEDRIIFFRKYLEVNKPWDEEAATLAHTIITTKMSLDPSCIALLVKTMEREAHRLASSLSFAKYLREVINKFGKEFDEQSRDKFKNVLQDNKTFLKKSLENGLKKSA